MIVSLTRHEQRKAATHQSLIDAARAVIVEKGYQRVDILDITERANVSKATFYKHFPNKEECVRELMQQGFDALIKQIMSVEGPTPVSPEWVRSSLEQAFVWAEDNREFLLIMIGGAASSQLNAFGRRYAADIIEHTILAEFVRDGGPTHFPPTLEAQIVTGMMIQLLGWWLENDTGYSAAEMADFVHVALLHGITQQDEQSHG
ncbi:MAG TPA: TetR/AcrR family transcriptional regulator [Aggregatilineaceae bacterium]|nr:TetR/AcrR family transcriptional regulator [Aggregatilineaceae bacterium]